MEVSTKDQCERAVQRLRKSVLAVLVVTFPDSEPADIDTGVVSSSYDDIGMVSSIVELSIEG